VLGRGKSYIDNFKYHFLVNLEVPLVPFVHTESSVASGVVVGVGIVLVAFTPLEDLTQDWLRHVWEWNSFPGDDLPTKVCA